MKKVFILGLFLVAYFIIQCTDADINNYWHEEFYKNESRMPVFNASQNSFVYPTPKFCTRKERPQQRPRTKRNQTTGDFSNDDAGDIFISLWANFLNEFYWDDGNEYTSWINRRDVQFEDKEQESRFLNLLILIPIALYLILMLLTGLFAPIVGFILFRILYFLWTIVWNRYTRKFLRAIWLWREIRKRKEVLEIYCWEKRVPKLRAQLPWALRHYPEEEIPDELRDLIPDSGESSASSDDEDQVLHAFYESKYAETDKMHGKGKKLKSRLQIAQIRRKGKFQKRGPSGGTSKGGSKGAAKDKEAGGAKAKEAGLSKDPGGANESGGSGNPTGNANASATAGSGKPAVTRNLAAMSPAPKK